MGNQRQILSKNLKRLIKSKGIDQKQLAEHLGISEMAVSNWVQGNKYPRISNIQKMADYFSQTVLSRWINNHSKPSLEKAFKLADLLGCKVDDLYYWSEDDK